MRGLDKYNSFISFGRNPKSFIGRPMVAPTIFVEANCEKLPPSRLRRATSLEEGGFRADVGIRPYDHAPTLDRARRGAVVGAPRWSNSFGLWRPLEYGCAIFRRLAKAVAR